MYVCARLTVFPFLSHLPSAITCISSWIFFRHFNVSLLALYSLQPIIYSPFPFRIITSFEILCLDSTFLCVFPITGDVIAHHFPLSSSYLSFRSINLDFPFFFFFSNFSLTPCCLHFTGVLSHWLGSLTSVNLRRHTSELAFFSFNIAWFYQICIAIETICPRLCSKSRPKSANRRSTSFWCALLINLVA